MAVEFLDIPISREANYKQSLILSGQLFFMQLAFNNSMNLWAMSLFDENDIAIFTGRALVLGANVFRGTQSGLPLEADMFVVDLTETHTEADFDNLGDSVRLTYVATI